MEKVIAGKRVVFKDSYPLKDNKDLIPLYRAMDPADPMTAIPVAVRMVTEWEFDGDPTGPAAYEEMDAMEFWALYRAINDFWFDRVVSIPKPLANGSTVP